MIPDVHTSKEILLFFIFLIKHTSNWVTFFHAKWINCYGTLVASVCFAIRPVPVVMDIMLVSQ